MNMWNHSLTTYKNKFFLSLKRRRTVAAICSGRVIVTVMTVQQLTLLVSGAWWGTEHNSRLFLYFPFFSKNSLFSVFLLTFLTSAAQLATKGAHKDQLRWMAQHKKKKLGWGICGG
jgi:hypothetical protein